MKLKLLTLSFLLFFIGIVYLASSGSTLSFVIYDKVNCIPFYDKILHFGLLGTMTFLVNSSFKTKTVHFGKFGILMGTIVIAGLITFEEFSQLFITYRNFEIMDLICNYAGILAGNFVFQHSKQLSFRPKLF